MAGRKVLLVNQASRALMVEIVNAHADSGLYDEVVLACGNEIPARFRLNPAVKLQKIAKYNTKSTITRTLSWIKATIKLVFLCWFKYRKYELFLVSNPPTSSFVTRFCRNKYDTLIYDVYPDGLAITGFMTPNNIIYKLWAKHNRKFYKKARHVFTITEGMAKTISQYCPADKIEVVSLWSDPNLAVIKEPFSVNRFRVEQKITDKFVVMYSGNIGRGHDLLCLIEAAKKLESYDDILFYFIGEGYLKPILQERAKELGLEKTCRFLPYQPLEMLPYSLSSSNIAVVSTSVKGGDESIPSKVFDLIKIGKPVLCIAEQNSEIAKLVNKHNIGSCISSRSVDEITQFILDSYNNPELLLEYSKNAEDCSKLYTNDLAKQFVKAL